MTPVWIDPDDAPRSNPGLDDAHSEATPVWMPPDDAQRSNRGLDAADDAPRSNPGLDDPGLDDARSGCPPRSNPGLARTIHGWQGVVDDHPTGCRSCLVGSGAHGQRARTTATT
jgi:hypothetical protein